MWKRKLYRAAHPHRMLWGQCPPGEAVMQSRLYALVALSRGPIGLAVTGRESNSSSIRLSLTSNFSVLRMARALNLGLHGQGGLACCDSWGHKEWDTTERLNWTEPISPSVGGKQELPLTQNILRPSLATTVGGFSVPLTVEKKLEGIKNWGLLLSPDPLRECSGAVIS